MIRFAAAALLLLVWFPRPLPAALTVVLVRHAETGDARTEDPPLSAAGRARSERIAALLADSGIRAIYVTEYLRTRQTAEPLARRIQIDPQVIPAAETAKLIGAVRMHRSGAVLVVGHSTTLPAIIRNLGGPTVAVAPGDFDHMYVLTLSARTATLLRLRTAETASGGTEPGGAASSLSKRSSIMQIKFVRSGGFAGRATNVEGTLTFDANGAKVTSDAANYERDVPQQEAERIRAAADPARLRAAVKAAKPGPARDAYQYEVTLTNGEGPAESYTLVPGAGPEMQTLSNWVQQEADRIWQHRLNRR